MSSQEFYRRTGGTLCIQTWTVTGNLLVLQHVQKFLKDLVEEFERPKIPEIWPNAEYYLTGVFYMQPLQALPTTFKIVCWPFDNAGFFLGSYTIIAWFLFLVCNVFVLIKYFVASYYNSEFHYFDFLKKRWPRYRTALWIRQSR